MLAGGFGSAVWETLSEAGAGAAHPARRPARPLRDPRQAGAAARGGRLHRPAHRRAHRGRGGRAQLGAHRGRIAPDAEDVERGASKCAGRRAVALAQGAGTGTQGPTVKDGVSKAQRMLHMLGRSELRQALTGLASMDGPLLLRQSSIGGPNTDSANTLKELNSVAAEERHMWPAGLFLLGSHARLAASVGIIHCCATAAYAGQIAGSLLLARLDGDDCSTRARRRERDGRRARAEARGAGRSTWARPPARLPGLDVHPLPGGLRRRRQPARHCRLAAQAGTIWAVIVIFLGGLLASSAARTAACIIDGVLLLIRS